MTTTILVVDDSPLSLKQVEKFLQPTKYEVSTATTARSAVTLLEEQKFDIVVTDKNMPGLGNNSDEGGMDLLRFIQMSVPGTEVIMMTGYASIETAITAMKLGAFDYLIKPFTNEELLDSISRLLSYKAFINPNDTIHLYKEMHNEILTLMEHQRNIDDEESHRILKSLDAKMDLFFKTQQNWEKIILTQREALASIVPLAEQLKCCVDTDESVQELIDKILTYTEERL